VVEGKGTHEEYGLWSDDDDDLVLLYVEALCFLSVLSSISTAWLSVSDRET